VDGDAGDFSLAIAVEGHPAGTLVHVTVSARRRSKLVLDFSDREHVVTDASVLLCGSVGVVRLLDLGYTGPLAERPPVTGWKARPHAKRP
jgi:hypothetical protein